MARSGGDELGIAVDDDDDDGDDDVEMTVDHDYY